MTFESRFENYELLQPKLSTIEVSEITFCLVSLTLFLFILFIYLFFNTASSDGSDKKNCLTCC